MKKRLLILLTAAFVLLLPLAAPAASAAGDPNLPFLQSQVAAGRLDAAVLTQLTSTGQARGLLVFQSGLAPTSSTAASNGYAALKQKALGAAGPSATLLRNYSKLATALVYFGDSTGLANILKPNSGVSAVREDRRNTVTLAESLPLINQPLPFSFGHTGAGYSVAILDTGVDYLGTLYGNGATSFGDCSGGVNTGTCKVAYAQDFAPDDGFLDDNSHGTNVAAIALAVAPGAKVLGLDVFSGGGASDSDIIAALNFVVADRTGPNVYNIAATNMSLGVANSYNASQCSGSVYDAPFATLRAAGVLPVVSSGNSAFAGGPTFNLGISYPACAPGAVSVGAVYDSAFGQYQGSCTGLPGGGDTAAADRVSCFSQTASYLSVLAPGARITAAGINFSGTSQAAPHVAGAIAVLAQAAPASSAGQRETALTTSGPAVVDWRTAITRNRLDLCAAINTVAGNPNACQQPPAGTAPAALNSLLSAVTTSGAATASRLATYLKSAASYLVWNTATWKAAACQQLKLFKAAVTVAIRTDVVVAASGPGWIAQADAIRAGIPCLPPN